VSPAPGTEERARLAYDIYAKAQQKFDYFVTGGAGTLLAYSVQAFNPAVASRFDFLAPLSWGCLVVSVGAGLWHIGATVALLKVGAFRFTAQMDIDELRESTQTGQPLYYRPAGKMLSARQASELLNISTEEMDKMNDFAKKRGSLQLGLARTRNVALIAGLIAICVWRALNL
jgi:hypothetical protein